MFVNRSPHRVTGGNARSYSIIGDTHPGHALRLRATAWCWRAVSCSGVVLSVVIVAVCLALVVAGCGGLPRPRRARGRAPTARGSRRPRRALRSPGLSGCAAATTRTSEAARWTRWRRAHRDHGWPLALRRGLDAGREAFSRRPYVRRPTRSSMVRWAASSRRPQGQLHAAGVMVSRRARAVRGSGRTTRPRPSRRGRRTGACR